MTHQAERLRNIRKINSQCRRKNTPFIFFKIPRQPNAVMMPQRPCMIANATKGHLRLPILLVDSVQRKPTTRTNRVRPTVKRLKTFRTRRHVLYDRLSKPFWKVFIKTYIAVPSQVIRPFRNQIFGMDSYSKRKGSALCPPTVPICKKDCRRQSENRISAEVYSPSFFSIMSRVTG